MGLFVAGCSRPSSASEPSGADLFAAACARCHGHAGGGGPPLPTGGAPRNFQDAAFQAARTDAELRATIAAGKPPGMPPFAAVFADRELDALVRHVRSFDPRRQGK